MRTIGLVLGFVMAVGCGDDGAPPATVDAGAADAGCAPFVGVGFTLAEDPAGSRSWHVLDVYAGTDAQAEGLTRGMSVSAIDGVSIEGMPRESVDAMFEGRAVGQAVAVDVEIGGTLVTKQIAVENVQPTCP
jgi:hypothetical protein